MSESIYLGFEVCHHLGMNEFDDQTDRILRPRTTDDEFTRKLTVWRRLIGWYRLDKIVDRKGFYEQADLSKVR